MNTVQLIIFDVDGLMIDSERIWYEAFEKAGTILHSSISGGEIFKKIVGKSGKDAREIVESYLGSDADFFRSMAHEIGFEQLNRQVPVKPGLYELLDWLDSLGIQKAIATSTVYELTERRLKMIDVFDRFDYILCGDAIQHKKPDPEIYETILNDMHVSCDHAIALEDSYYGVEAAHRAGIPCIMVPDLLEPTSKQEAETIQILPDLIRAQEWLKENIVCN